MLITTSIIFSIVVLSVVTYIVIQDENSDNVPNTIDDKVKEVDLEKIKH